MNQELQRAAKEVGFLSPEQESDLVARMLAGDTKARNRIVLAHLPLVSALASKFAAYGHDLDDLTSCGMIGLCKACDRFKPERTNGGRFATYAMWWIKAELNEHMMSTRSLVKIGTTAAQKKCYFGLNAAKARLGIDGVNLTEEQVKALAEDLSVPATVVVEMNMRLRPDASLNAPTLSGNHDAEYEMMDFLQDTSLVPADDALIAAQEQTADADAMEAALASLKPRERLILERRKLAEQPETLEVLSHDLQVSRERVRQVEARALEKVADHVKGVEKPRLKRKPPTTSTRKKRRERLEFVRANLDSMSVSDMAAAMGVSRKTTKMYLRTVQREKLPLAA